MKFPRTLVVALAVMLVACGSDDADKAEAAATEHFMSAQQKLLEQAKEVAETANEKIEEQKKAMEEASAR